jgi:hypothetical protein
MGNSIKKINDIKNGIDFLKDYSFELIFGVCIILIILFSMHRKYKGEKGSWSTNYFYDSKTTSLVDKNDSKMNRVRSDSKGEIECRRVLEKIFNKPFNKARPNFLNNPVTGGNFNLELDCYNEDLQIAVEYNGLQHYKYVPYFHKNNEAFLNQKYRDDMKRRICKDENIILIEVPYTVKVENIERFIKDELRIKLSRFNR